MKSFRIIITCILALGVLLFGTGVIIAKGDVSQVFEAFGNEERIEKELIVTDSFDTITLYTVNDNVTVMYNDTDELKIVYFDNENNHYKLTSDNGAVKFEYVLKTSIFNFKKYQVVVYLPKTYNQNLICNNTSGNINIDKLDLKEITISNTSGGVTTSNVDVNELKINATSSNVVIRDVNSTSVSIMLTSGSINVLKVQSTNIKINGTSVKVDMDDVKANTIDCSITSGSVSIDLYDDPDNYQVQFTTLSGDLDISGTRYDLDYSGSTVWGSGNNLIIVDTKSGDLDVEFDNLN